MKNKNDEYLEALFKVLIYVRKNSIVEDSVKKLWDLYHLMEEDKARIVVFGEEEDG